MQQRKFNAAVALGSLTAAVALLAGAPASAQTAPGGSDSISGQAAPGGGSFPGSFLVPGTNTSIKIGGFAKGVFIYDASAAVGGATTAVVVPGGIPLEGSAAHNLHGGVRIHAKQSNFAFDVRTPTAWGELDTFILTDFFGQNVSQTYANANTENARLVLAYGTLGPLLAGQALTLWFDGDALPEVVDPTATVGLMNGLTNRQPQFRYTYAGAGGISVAASVEQPVFEAFDNAGVLATGTVAGSINRYPDFVAKGRWDQAWGHVALAGVIRDQHVILAGVPRVNKTGWGIYLSGHLNTFGKDTLRGGFMIGQALGHYLSDIGAVGGLQTDLTRAGGPVATAPTEWGTNISYTHWWTDQLRSSASFGYSHLAMNGSTITIAAVQNALDLRHIGTVGNLVWSPVPQVDLGIEYDWVQRTTQTATAGNNNKGSLNRVEAEAVFKF